jgi:hypothetical protein
MLVTYSKRLHPYHTARCVEIKARDYENRLPPEAYTVHHWSHTWLGSVTDNVTVDVSPRLTKLPPFMREDDWAREVRMRALGSTVLSENPKTT